MINWQVVEDYDQLSRTAASLLLETVDQTPDLRIGLPTGSTPVGTYTELIRFCDSRYHCFRDVTTFNLDEYVGIPREDPGSYFSYMKKHLFDHVDIDPGNTHVPCGDPDLLIEGDEDLERALERECDRYERLVRGDRGIDLMLLGLGSNAHIAFNEPGTSFESKTHVVELDRSTIEANARFFPDRRVPEQAITMGISTILSAQRIVLLASGNGKRDAIDALRSGVRTEDIPASALHAHPNVTIICDRSASGER